MLTRIAIRKSLKKTLYSDEFVVKKDSVLLYLLHILFPRRWGNGLALRRHVFKMAAMISRQKFKKTCIIYKKKPLISLTFVTWDDGTRI